MKAEGVVKSSPAKPRRRKWARYGRRHSNAMWHVDRHVMRDSSLKGLNLVAYLDDASRCVTGFGVFESPASENATLVPRRAVREFGAPAQILSDDGSCFMSVRRANLNRRRPAIFEEELLDRDVVSAQLQALPSSDQRQAGEVLSDP